MSTPSLFRSVAFRLGLYSAALVMGCVLLLAAVFYFGTIGRLTDSVDRKIRHVATRLDTLAQAEGLDAVVRRINQSLSDGVDSDTEIFLLLDAQGRSLAGNIAPPLHRESDGAVLTERRVERGGQIVNARLLRVLLPEGARLMVGRDVRDLVQVRQVLWEMIAGGAAAALLLALIGSLLFRRLVEQRLLDIRQTAREIRSGRLDRRVPASGGDEFARLGQDINEMLARIQQLMDGVRHVSNTIAHNLRTPLGAIRTRLEVALRPESDAPGLAEAAGLAIQQIDQLIAIFERLLQIAETETGAARANFEPLSLAVVITDVAELYEPVAEEQGGRILVTCQGDVRVIADRELLASALSNLLENALAYGGPEAVIEISAIGSAAGVAVTVRDHGPGVPAAQRERVLEPFQRLDRSHPGNGLGLSIVAAIARLHRASLSLIDARPGLAVRLLFVHPNIDGS